MGRAEMGRCVRLAQTRGEARLGYGRFDGCSSIGSRMANGQSRQAGAFGARGRVPRKSAGLPRGTRLAGRSGILVRVARDDACFAAAPARREAASAVLGAFASLFCLA